MRSALQHSYAYDGVRISLSAEVFEAVEREQRLPSEIHALLAQAQLIGMSQSMEAGVGLGQLVKSIQSFAAGLRLTLIAFGKGKKLNAEQQKTLNVEIDKLTRQIESVKSGLSKDPKLLAGLQTTLATLVALKTKVPQLKGTGQVVKLAEVRKQALPRSGQPVMERKGAATVTRLVTRVAPSKKESKGIVAQAAKSSSPDKKSPPTTRAEAAKTDAGKPAAKKASTTVGVKEGADRGAKLALSSSGRAASPVARTGVQTVQKVGLTVLADFRKSRTTVVAATGLRQSSQLASRISPTGVITGNAPTKIQSSPQSRIPVDQSRILAAQSSLASDVRRVTPSTNALQNSAARSDGPIVPSSRSPAGMSSISASTANNLSTTVQITTSPVTTVQTVAQTQVAASTTILQSVTSGVVATGAVATNIASHGTSSVISAEGTAAPRSAVVVTTSVDLAQTGRAEVSAPGKPIHAGVGVGEQSPGRVTIEVRSQPIEQVRAGDFTRQPHADSVRLTAQEVIRTLPEVKVETTFDHSIRGADILPATANEQIARVETAIIETAKVESPPSGEKVDAPNVTAEQKFTIETAFQELKAAEATAVQTTLKSGNEREDITIKNTEGHVSQAVVAESADDFLGSIMTADRPSGDVLCPDCIVPKPT